MSDVCTAFVIDLAFSHVKSQKMNNGSSSPYSVQSAEYATIQRPTDPQTEEMADDSTTSKGINFAQLTCIKAHHQLSDPHIACKTLWSEISILAILP